MKVIKDKIDVLEDMYVRYKNLMGILELKRIIIKSKNKWD